MIRLYSTFFISDVLRSDSSKDLTLRTKMAFQRPFYFELKWKLFRLRKFAKLTNIFPKSGFSHIMTHFSRKLFDAGFRWKIRYKMNSFLKIDAMTLRKYKMFESFTRTKRFLILEIGTISQLSILEKLSKYQTMV